MAHTRSWDETAPAGGTTPAASLDTIIQNMKTDIRERMRLEHDYNGSQAPGTTYDGVLLEGAGRANTKVIASIPANRGTSPINGAAGNEDGRLFISTDTGEFMYSDGTNWLTAVKKITGTVGITGLISGLGDQVLYYSRQATVAAPAAYPAYNSGYLQGSAGFDFSARSGNSTCVFIALVEMNTTSNFQASMAARLCLDNVATVLGYEGRATPGAEASGFASQALILSYLNTVSNAAHSLDLQVMQLGGLAYNVLQAQIIVFDLGLTSP